MPRFRSRLELLSKEPQAVAVDILTSALPNCEPQERAVIAEELLRLGEPSGIACVIRDLHRFGDADLKAWNPRNLPASLETGMRIALTPHRPQVAANVLRLIRFHPEARAAGILADLLTGDDPALAAEAGRMLLWLVEQLLGGDGCRSIDASSRAELEQALLRCAETYRAHRVDEALVAIAVAAPRAGSALQRLLSQEDHPSLLALRRIMSRTDLPHIRRNLLRWLTMPQLTRSAARWLHSMADRESFNDLLSDDFLLHNPRRLQRLRQVDRPVKCIPSITIAATLNESAQCGFVTYVASLGLSAAVRRQRLMQCAALPAPLAKLRALKHLAGDCNEDTLRVMEQLISDSSEPVATAALDQLCTPAGHIPTHLTERCERSSHPSIARESMRSLSARSVADFFERWMQLCELDRLAAAHLVAARQRETFIARLGEVLATSADRTARLAAVKLIRCLSLADELADTLIVQAAGEDSKLASAIVMALGDSNSPDADEALRVALRHRDARVRANAVEAITRINPQRAIDLVAPLVNGRDNRPRANAILTTLRDRRQIGLDSLEHMLSDRNPLHRVSALWAARRSAAVELNPNIVQMAGHDPAPEIRFRARAVQRYMDRHQQMMEMAL